MANVTRRGFLKRTGMGTGIGAIAGSTLVGGSRTEGAEPETAGKTSHPAEGTSVVMSDTTEVKTAQLPAGENEMSRRYLRIIEKWIPIGVEYFHTWPVRPRCGHFFGGAHWYGLETSLPAEVFAVAAISPEYDESTTGVSRTELTRRAVEAIRYLGFTHDTGPEDCVRPATGLGRRENFNKKWGERGRGFFPESQCGSVIATMARVCLLLRDQVDEETWMMVARIHEDYAQRFGSMSPKSGVYLNTQMEENAWTSYGLTSCFLFLSGHKKSGEWESMARRWMFSTCTVPQDAKDLGSVGKAKAASLVGGAFTALPDYWAENHGMVHPSYTTSGVLSLANLGCQLRLWGRELPPELFWNRRRICDNLKIVTDDAGYCQPIQGMDWPYLPPFAGAAPHATAAVFFTDADAAAMEHRALRHAELRQEGNHGRMYDKALAEKAHGPQDPTIMRELAISTAARLYLLHRLFGAGPDPTPEDELQRRLSGVRVFPHAGFVHHRHTAGQTSFSWRNSIMALLLPKEGIYTVAPCSNTWLGRPTVKGQAESHRLVSVKIAESCQGVAAALVMDRCQESLRQQVLFASLPDGRVLSWERFLANRDLELESFDQGFLQITNETFQRLGANSRGTRTLYYNGGTKDYRGWLGDSQNDDVIDRLGRPDWLNIDDRIGIRLAAPGETIYHNRHYYKPYRALADDLILSSLKSSRHLRAGDATPPLVCLLALGQEHTKTPECIMHQFTGPTDSAALATNGYLTAANFLETARVCVFTMPRPETIPTFSGVTIEVDEHSLRCHVHLDAWGVGLFGAERTLRIDGDVRIDSSPQGRIYVQNTGSRVARVDCTGDGEDVRSVSIAVGDVRAI